MTASVLRSAWAQLGPQLGPLASLEPQAQGMEEGLHLVVLTCRCQPYLASQYIAS